MSDYKKGELVRNKKCGSIGLVIWVMDGIPGLATLFQVHWIGQSNGSYVAEWFREGTDFQAERVEKLCDH